MNFAQGNEWVWNSRWTHWWLKAMGPGTEKESCMESSFSKVLDKSELLRSVDLLKKANINTVLVEGLRNLIRFEHEGKTDQVIEAIKNATKICHDAGIKVIHHTTTTFASPWLEKIPASSRDWLNIDARTGEYAFVEWKDDWAGSGWYLWCINNPDFRHKYFNLCEKYFKETGIDGLMTDEVYFRSGWHNCSCQYCRSKFHKKTGLTLPAGDADYFWGHLDNPAFRAWIRFRAASVGDFYQDLNASISKAHPHPILLGCKNQAECPAVVPWFGDCNEERMRGVNLLFTELNSTSTSILYSWRRLSTCYMAYNGLSNYYGTPTNSVTYASSDEAFLSWAMRVAHGIRIWATSGGGALKRSEQLLNNPKDLHLYEELFGWQEEHKNELTGPIQPLANVGILLSASTRDLAHKNQLEDWESSYITEWAGWCETLASEYVQYAVILEDQLKLSYLQKFALIILPNVVCMSDAAFEAVVEYVSNGGALIITDKTASCDETGMQKSISSRLGRLGICINQTCEKINPNEHNIKFGNYCCGKWIYFSYKPGHIVYENFNNFEETRTMEVPVTTQIIDKDKRFQKTLMMDAVESIRVNESSLNLVKAPGGLLIKAFSREDNKDVIIHFVNLRGALVKVGEKIPANVPVEFPEQEEDICIRLPLDQINDCYLISPDWSGKKPVKVTKNDKGYDLTIAAHTLNRYAVLYVARSC